MKVYVRPPKAANDVDPRRFRVENGVVVRDALEPLDDERQKKLDEAVRILEELRSATTAQITGAFVLLKVRRFFRTAPTPAAPELLNYDPLGAEFVLRLLCGPKEREAILQDLAELFERDLLNGRDRWQAKALYWAGVARSVLPLAWAATRRITWFGTLVAAVRRLVS